MFGNRKVKVSPSKHECQPDVIHWQATDDMHQRAANIWRSLGFVNDRLGAVPQIAAWLGQYRDWDRQAPLGRCFECQSPLSMWCPACNKSDKS